MSNNNVLILFFVVGICGVFAQVSNPLLFDNLVAELFQNLTAARDDLTNPQMWPSDYAEELLTQRWPQAHDYIVIGAGNAGSVVASRLSENPNVSVLVLEAGGDPPSLSEVYTLSNLLQKSEYTWNDYAEPNPTSCQGMKDGRCFWLRGKMISGTAGINGNVFLMGRPEDYDEWESQGNQGWSWENVYKHFEKATHDESSPENPKGSLVLNNFLRPEDFYTLRNILENATEEVETDYEVKSLGFTHDIMGTVDRGRRMSTGKTYLGKVARYRRNLHVAKNAVVRKILFNGWNKVAGVEVLLRNKKLLRLQARKEIILSAGTFNSPQILMHSGIGPCDNLRKLKISCMRNLAVGENLQDHGMMSMTYKFTKNIPQPEEADSLTNTFQYLAYQNGSLAANRNLVGFINSQASQNFVNKSDVMIVSGIDKPLRGANMFEFLQFRDEFVEEFLRLAENETTLELQGLLIKPKSRGSVKLKYPIFGRGPEIHNNYASVEEDRQTLLRYIRFVRSLEKTEMFRHYGLEYIRLPLEECDTWEFDSDDYWYCYIKYFMISAWHAAGTCKMGPATDPTAVVDEKLRVHGIKGLRVIDASIMPNITSGNTNGPTIMIAEKGAQMILEELQRW
ncbi:glucose dehydrogenase [FAD, quinone]-like [Musca vetustissima]|uniref:glucose dehydrogenase [FAD, quinone]-like n=1 Tax=Musca vetustissima TaxID=27455 RepID=UPI002AB6E419|nr:glucose dehydrogenase [FAD, quinone]-like [Musca vetustissima]